MIWRVSRTLSFPLRHTNATDGSLAVSCELNVLTVRWFGAEITELEGFRVLQERPC